MTLGQSVAARIINPADTSGHFLNGGGVLGGNTSATAGFNILKASNDYPKFAYILNFIVNSNSDYQWFAVDSSSGVF